MLYTCEHGCSHPCEHPCLLIHACDGMQWPSAMHTLDVMCYIHIGCHMLLCFRARVLDVVSDARDSMYMCIHVYTYVCIVVDIGIEEKRGGNLKG